MGLRDDVLFRYLQRKRPVPQTWLDVGAGNGEVSRRLANELKPAEFFCIDVMGAPGVEVFDGKRLPHKNKVFDFVLFNFVLHHAAYCTRSLVRDALAIAHEVIIQEDIPDGTETTATLLYKHDPRGIFRTEDQWVRLFAECGAQQLYQERHAGAVSDTGGYHVPRTMMVFNGKPPS